MTFEVSVVDHFNARHHLVGDFGPASEPHSHAYRVVATVRGPDLRPDGTLIDMTILQSALRTALAALENSDLNTVPVLAEPNPTAEVVAHHIYGQIASALSTSAEVRVEVWESDEAFAAYSANPATSRR